MPVSLILMKTKGWCLAMIRGITAAFHVTAANVIAVWYTTCFAALKNH